MRVPFTKMHGLGNDFLVLDWPAARRWPSAAQWRAWANRRTGIGFDQALILQAARTPDADAYYRIVNADGGEVEQCGNGARCVAALLHARSGASALRLDSVGGRLEARIAADGSVAVCLGVPNFDPASLPFLTAERQGQYELVADGLPIVVSALSIGNPHVVLRVPDVATAPVERIGRALQSHASFPRQVNVGFAAVLAPERIALRVYERGVGETLACGTGACAAVAAGRALGWLAPTVDVHVPGGVLGVNWPGPGEPIWLSGPVAVAYEGSFEFDERVAEPPRALQSQ